MLWPRRRPIRRAPSPFAARRATLVVALTMALLSTVAGGGPLAAATPASAAPSAAAPGPATVIDCGQAANRISVTTDAVLDPACTYSGGVDITASHSTLDCRGAAITAPPGSSGAIGILISTTIAVPLDDVTVRNCHVHGFLNGLRVTRDGFRTLAAGQEYDHGTSAITIEDSSFEGSAGVGVYVDGYVTGVTLRRLLLQDDGSTGVYLETGSKDNVVADSQFLHNGYTENSPSGQPYSLAGHTFWFWGTGREALAVDGSRDNLITGNTFRGNSAGGVFLYTNCGEYYIQHADSWLPRRYGSTGNVLRANTFDGEPIGVWVASRMGQNTLPMECSDPAYVATPFQRVTLDRASGTTIDANVFRSTAYGIRVEDDATRITGNTFTGPDPGTLAVLVGTQYRTTALHRPVTGTVLTGNQSSITGNPAPYRWVFDRAATTDVANQADGGPAALCPGTAPAPDPFIFTRAFVLYEPGSPPPTKPPIAPVHPPAQPPCAHPVSAPTTTAPAAPPTSGAPPVLSPIAQPVAATPDFAG